MKRTLHIATLLTLLLLAGSAHRICAQSFYTQDPRDGTAMDPMQQAGTNNPYAGEVELDENGNPIEPQEGTDSLRVKEIMPLESYFFDDSIRVRKHFRWVADTYANHVVMGEVDTLLGKFSRDYPFQVEDVGDAHVGILGGVSEPINYFRRQRPTNFDFTAGYYSYLFTTDNAYHYNNKRPYTTLAYQMAGQTRTAENKLALTHAQNITPSTGISLRYNTHHSRGIYSWQRGKVQDFAGALSHTGKRYTIHAGVITNSISQRENGGVVEAWHITDTVYESAQGLPMKMSDALNKANNTSLYLVQSYGIPFVPMPDSVFTMADRTAIHFGHAVVYNQWGKHYTDTRKGTTYKITDRETNKVLEERNFYNNWYIDPTTTSDTLTESVLSNRLFVQFVPYDRNGVVGTIDGGVGWDHQVYRQFRLQDYIKGNSATKRNTYYAYADARGKLGKWFDWQGRARVNVAGYRAGDIDFDANAVLRLYLKDVPIELSGHLGYDLQSATYWQEHYFSNHFAWENKFARQNFTQLDVSLDIPLTGTRVTFNQALVSNLIYYGLDATPTQSAGIESVTAIKLEQNFAFGGLHLDHTLLLQRSSSDIIPVPSWAANLSYYYSFQPVKNVLTMNVGLDCWANSPYYAQAYNPALMTFHNQNEVLVGNYPYTNVFVTAKWKTVRLMIQYQHANEGLFEKYKASYSTPYYPYNRSILKYGICWYFDD